MNRLALRRRREPNHESMTVSRGQRREPKLPHERDESSDGTAPLNEADQRVMRRAARDLALGVVDTDVGPVLDRIRADHFSSPRRRGGKTR